MSGLGNATPPSDHTPLGRRAYYASMGAAPEEATGADGVALSSCASFWNATLSVSLRITQRKERDMDWNRVEGNWKQVKGKVKEQWGKLTDDDLDVIAGKQDQLEGKLQERYGYAKDRAQKEMNDWYGRQTW